jgi:hypothetical protein
LTCREAVAGLIQVEDNLVATEVDEVTRAAPVNVAKADAAWVEFVHLGEDGAFFERDFGSETAVAEVRPVAHFAVSHAYDVYEAISTHVGELYGLGAVSENNGGATVFVEVSREFAA